MNIKKLSREALESLFNFVGLATPAKSTQVDLPEWKQRSRADKTSREAAPPDLKREHRASVLSAPVKFKRPRLHGKRNGAKAPTQHDRVVMSRAARLGLSVREYEARRGE